MFTVYRGLQTSQEELGRQFKLGDTVNLLGFTSTSLSMERALGFATQGIGLSSGAEKVAILLEITVRGAKQFFFLNSAEYSSYPYEQEVLLQEGIKYRVLAMDRMTFKQVVEGQEVETEVAVIKLEAIGDKYSQMNCCRRGIHYLAN